MLFFSGLETLAVIGEITCLWPEPVSSITVLSVYSLRKIETQKRESRSERGRGSLPLQQVHEAGHHS